MTSDDEQGAVAKSKAGQQGGGRGTKRPHRLVMLDQDTLAELHYLQVQLSPFGEREPLDFSAVGRIVILDAQSPEHRDRSFTFPSVYAREGNEQLNFWLDEESLTRWKQLVDEYQAVVDQQVISGVRKPGTGRRITRVSDADVMRLLIRQKAAGLRGPGPKRRGRPPKQV